MNNINPDTDKTVLEQQLQQKIEQFTKAKEEGRTLTELNSIYKELKELRHQLDFTKPLFR